MRPPPASSGLTDRQPAVPRRVPAVNGLRGIAILAVIYFHVIAGVWHARDVPPPCRRC